MLEDNIKKISKIINDYYKKYGEQIKNWATLTGYLSIKKLAEYLESKCMNVTKNLKDLQSAIKDIVVGIYKDKTQRPGNIYDGVIEQLEWEIPSNKKNTAFYQFLKHYAPKIKYKWTEIEKDFRNILEQTINRLERDLINNINNLDWEEGEILEDLKESLSKELVDFINDRCSIHDWEQAQNKMYPSDIAKIVEDFNKLNVYKTLKQMIDNNRKPNWITNFWNGNGIDLDCGYKSDSFQNVSINNNCIIDISENTCVQTITSYFEKNIGYKDYCIWVNITAGDEIIPTDDITRINMNDKGLEGDWDIIFDNILYFVRTRNSTTDDIMMKLLKNEAKRYLRTLEFLQHELRRDYRGYYCNALLQFYNDDIRIDHGTPDDYLYDCHKEKITPFIFSLFRYILFPSKERYTKLSEEWNKLQQYFNDEIRRLFLEKHKNYSLKNIDVSQKEKDSYDCYIWDDDNDKSDINNALLFDISKCLLDEFENKKNFSENYKAEICNYYIFGNKTSKKIDKANNPILKKKELSNAEKLKILFMCLEQYPSTIKSTFKYETLYDKDYQKFIYCGKCGIEDFIENAYKIIGKDKNGEPIRKMKTDDYKPNGKFFNQTKYFFELPKKYLLNEKTLNILGKGCSEILDNCNYLVNYALAMQYNPLISKDKKEERIFELICCYPEIYNSFIKS